LLLNALQSKIQNPKSGCVFALNLRFGRWQRVGNHLRIEAAPSVGAIAKGLIGALAAATKLDDGAAGKVEFLAIRIDDFEVVALDLQ